MLEFLSGGLGPGGPAGPLRRRGGARIRRRRRRREIVVLGPLRLKYRARVYVDE